MNYQQKTVLQYFACPYCERYQCNDGTYAQYYTDGACSGNHQHYNRDAGCGVHYTIEGKRFDFKQNLSHFNIREPVTSNTAEVQAVRTALILASNERLEFHAKNRDISISSDSEYTLDAICRGYAEWHFGCNKSGKRNDHWHLICEIRQLMNRFSSVIFYKCNGHGSGRYSCGGNRAADDLAVSTTKLRPTGHHGGQGYAGGSDFIR